MGNMDLVSIIVPVYNAEKVLKRCVDSILKQDYQNIEVILVDDGSKDTSLEIMNEYARQDERVKAVHKENGGVSSTRNKGLDMASGKYIQFIDADDWLPFDSTKQLVRTMEDNDVDMAIGDFYRVVNEQASLKGSIKNGGIITRNEYADKMLLTPADFYYGVIWNKLYRRDIIEQHHLRMDEEISFSEDMIFNLEYLLYVEKIGVLKAPVYYYFLTEGSLVQQNLSLKKLLKMKTSVISYYAGFYRAIFTEGEYKERKPVIYGFLAAVSTDALAIPVLDRTVRLGDEGGRKVFFDDELQGTDIMFSSLSNAFLDKLLNTLALQQKLEVTEARILYVLSQLKRPAVSEEIASLCQIDSVSTAVALAHLVTLGYVKAGLMNLLAGEKLSYAYVSGPLDSLLEQVSRDYEAVCFAGLTDDEIQQYLQLRERIEMNMKDKTV